MLPNFRSLAEFLVNPQTLLSVSNPYTIYISCR